MESVRSKPAYRFADLREFLGVLEERGELVTIDEPVDPNLELTEISRRTLARGGPALLFTQAGTDQCRVLTNLFGTPERIAAAMGADSVAALGEIGTLLAHLRAPKPPSGLGEAIGQLPLLKELINLAPKTTTNAPSQQIVLEGDAANLGEWPIATCWPGDAGPLITWGLTSTCGPQGGRENLGIYRHQVIGPRRMIMRWLAHRGGALDYADWCRDRPTEPFPVAISIGADPATILAAVTPIPDNLSEYAFAGLLRGQRTQLTECIGSSLKVPALAEITIEGHILPGDTAAEGPFGDHTGYYNEVEQFPVLTVDRITHRPEPIYLSTYTGRAPDEPSVLGLALNEVFVPILKTQFPEIVDFYLPPEACSYRIAVVSFRKQYLGHAKRLMFGIWSFLRQFMYTKFVIVTDDDIDVRNWEEVVWALSTRMDPARDTIIIENTPIDYLDFASPVAGLGSKLGFDATNKWPGETQRNWGTRIEMDADVIARIDALWPQLGID